MLLNEISEIYLPENLLHQESIILREVYLLNIGHIKRMKFLWQNSSPEYFYKLHLLE